MVDFAPVAGQLKMLLNGTTDNQLSAPTPCTEYTVGDLLDHLMALTYEFRTAAEKTPGAGTKGPPEASAGNLPADWREQLPARLDALVEAWADPVAWTGETRAGGVTMPAEMMGVIALDEVAVHSWDLARATGQPFECDQGSTEALFALLSQSTDEDGKNGLFGPVAAVPADAPLFDRVLGLTGRDPAWKP
ncbi:TIGR03086 family protein [Amycolatopsis marina]|uniref:TIGR03086 family protein n=1 Tax=Amycolatopsis marina TaxID=490629 RepID=A0A1I0Y3K7_9PSEU|nr:TIGR03086 family metal-binding protein [Amycolatopsis marina]SFB07286.1 TIGR03086 family protein [Amycolatopsis marina]